MHWHLSKQSPQDLVTSVVNPTQQPFAHAVGFLQVREGSDHATQKAVHPCQAKLRLG